jgi:hypothetical protein
MSMLMQQLKTIIRMGKNGEKNNEMKKVMDTSLLNFMVRE